MPISHRLECLFVHIPKTGGTSVEHALRMRAWHGKQSRRRMFGPIVSEDLRKRRFGSGFLQHLTMSEILSLDPAGRLSGYLSFSVVRNPWDRMVSVYSRMDGHMLERAGEAGLDLDGLTFGAFVDATEGFEHAHLRPQVDYTTDPAGRSLVDHLCRFETLESCFGAVCARLGIRRRLPKRYASAQRAGRDYRDFYTARTRRLVGKRFARDVETFGYAFDG